MDNIAPVMDMTPLIEQFKGHLGKEWNQYLIFSGQYGIGKTYFLNKFFETAKKQVLDR